MTIWTESWILGYEVNSYALRKGTNLCLLLSLDPLGNFVVVIGGQVRGWWLVVCKPILVFSFGLSQAEQYLLLMTNNHISILGQYLVLGMHDVSKVGVSNNA